MQHATINGIPRRTFRLSSAALAMALSLGSIEASAGSATDEGAAQQTTAQARYEQGALAYREQRFKEAIELFLAADRLDPRPALAFNVARAYEKLQEPARALQHYRDYLRRGPDPSNLAEVRTRVRELEATLAERGVQQVTVRSKPPGATLFIDGVVRGTTPWTGELPIGTHQVHAEHEDYQSRRVSVTVDGEEALELALALPAEQRSGASSAAPPEPVGRNANGHGVGEHGVSEQSDIDSAGLQPWPWVAAGTGGAALAAAGVFELLRRSAESDAESARYQTDYYTHRDRMTSHQTTARVLFGAGAILALSGGVLALIDGAAADTEPAPVALGCDGRLCVGTWMGKF